MSFPDFRNALRMTWAEAKPLVWILPGLPLVLWFLVSMAGDNRGLGGSAFLMQFYIFSLIPGVTFVFPQQTNWGKRSQLLPLEFALTRAVSREAFHAARTVVVFLFPTAVWLLFVLAARLLSLSVPDLPRHLAAMLALVSLANGIALSLHPHPRVQTVFCRTIFFFVVALSSLLGNFVRPDIVLLPLFLPSCLTVILVTQFAAYRAFLRQEIRS